MKKSKQMNNDVLNELFDLEIEPPKTYIDSIHEQENEQIQDVDYVDVQLKQLLQNSNDILDAAKTMILAAPDNPDLLSSTSNVISSIGQLITEFNKTVLLDKTYKKKIEYLNEKHKKELEKEKMRIEARQNLALLKSPQTPQIGSGNTIIQNNNYISYSQEDVIKELLALEKEEDDNNKELPVLNKISS